MKRLRLIRRWWPKRDGRVWLRVRLGYWRERSEWPVPGSVFQWDGWLPDLWYFLKCAVWKRYDRVEIPTLSPTWNEWDGKLLHAAMAVFTDYMDGAGDQRWTVAALDQALAEPDPDGHSHHWCADYRPTAVEMEAIYHWWTVEREREQREESDSLRTWHDKFEQAGGMKSVPTENPRLNRLMFAEDAEADRLHAIHHEIEQRNEAKDEEMLIRLMKIRQSLWT